MELVESVGWTGLVTVTVRDLDGMILREDTFPNLITDKGREYLVNQLRHTIVCDGYGIYSVVIGDDATPPTVADTALGNQTFRKAVTRQEPGAFNQLVTTTYLAPYEANGQIEEIGWKVSGNNGLDGLMARVLYSHTKTNLESIQITRTDTIT